VTLPSSVYFAARMAAAKKNKVKWARLFQPHFFQWMRGSRVKLKSLKKA